ncbi:SBBP repeat-containing protein, partial [bacterium AH-315-M05]|nr:SBBP repeat-containing protein [bacterium AH-315-M05]
MLKQLLSVLLFTTISSQAQVVEKWVAAYNGSGKSDNDYGRAMHIDSAGNIYVTGESFNGSNYDYVTVKYNNSGTLQWAAVYNGIGNGPDYPKAISVDDSGYVYVTGRSIGIIGGYNYATIKYDSSGVQQWAATYNGSGNNFDYAEAIAVDDAGNVFVTGLTWNGSNRDYATLKYNASGVQQWAAIYNGSGSGNDYAYDIALDTSGNVFITGQSYNGTNDDCVTIKYNPVSGAEVWVASYNGSANNYDHASAIAVDSSGNVYITGWASNGTNNDYATIKYNPSGVEQWAAIYNGIANGYDYAYDIDLDNSGNVYVTGMSYNGSNSDYTTVKYNSSGTQQWAAVYNGSGNGIDQANSISVDNSGNVSITGQSYNGSNADYVTIKYNSSGTQQWAAVYNGSGNGYDIGEAIVVDGSGNVYVTGYSPNVNGNNDYVTIKYSSSGIQQWAAVYNGNVVIVNDYARDIAVDDSGNVYVTGQSYNDYATVKYNANGVQQWDAIRIGAATAIAVDSSGNVYVTGSSLNGTNNDYATIKYNISGIEQWVAFYDGGFGYDKANAIAVDNSGNVYVTGYIDNGFATMDDYATIKYNSLGIQQWATTYNGSGSMMDQAHAITLDNSGNVYVTGNSDNGFATMDDYTTIKYNSSGAQMWVALYNGSGSSVDAARDIVLDGSGNVYVTGESTNTSFFNDYVTVKYNNSGAQQWAAIYDGSGLNDDQAKALALDTSANVYVTGQSYNGTNYDYATIKYNTGGIQQWATIYNGTGLGNDYGNDIVVDDSSNVFVTGRSSNGANDDYATVKYNTSGVQQWAVIYNGSGNGSDQANSIALDTSGNVYVTGQGSNGSNDDYVTIMYCQPQIPVVATVSNDTAICNGDSVNLTASGGTKYLWSPGSTLSDSTIANPVATPSVTTTYTVIVSNDCASDTDSVTVTINTIYSTTTPDDTICDGDSVIIFGIYRTTAGTYYDTLTAVSGCDSVIITTL